MFTGIVEEVGEVIEAGDGTLRIGARKVMADAQLGDSIAINGVDLTVAEMDGRSFFAHVMPETYRRSNLGLLRPGHRVNLERSVRPTDRLSGHIVRGVVEGRATIESFTPEADAVIARFRTPAELLRYIVVKGPVAIDGASLTVIDKTPDSFAVSLVQYTQENTCLLGKQPGDVVNIETDIIARYVENLLASSPMAAARVSKRKPRGGSNTTAGQPRARGKIAAPGRARPARDGGRAVRRKRTS